MRYQRGPAPVTAAVTSWGAAVWQLGIGVGADVRADPGYLRSDRERCHADYIKVAAKALVPLPDELSFRWRCHCLRHRHCVRRAGPDGRERLRRRGRRGHAGGQPEHHSQAADHHGSYTFSVVGQADCARFIASHSVDADKLFTHFWKLDDAVQAYQEFDKQTGGKAVFTF